MMKEQLSHKVVSGMPHHIRSQKQKNPVVGMACICKLMEE